MKLFRPGKDGKTPAAKTKTSLENCRSLSSMPCITADIFDRGENGYLNYARYEISGSGESGPQTTLINARSESEALENATSSGIKEPLTAVRRPHSEPLAKQVEYARDLGITLPPGLCEEDLISMINRVVEDDNDSPSTGLALYADKRGVLFSAWIGQRAFYNMMFAMLGARDRLAFFVYCVWCYLYSKPISDLDASDAAAECYRFADTYEQDKQINASISRYDGSSLIEFGRYSGKTRTAAFTAAVNFLRGYRIET